MKKIPTIFKRNPKNMKEILPEPHPDCLWVFSGEGIATRKYDGTCVKIEMQKYLKRRTVKKFDTVPKGFIEEDHDDTTGIRKGWIPVDCENDTWHMDGFAYFVLRHPLNLKEGTYELLGPKINGNPEQLEYHTLIKHNETTHYLNIPRTFYGLQEWLKGKDIEGIVFYHLDGRMGKIKKKDFGLKRSD